MQLHSTTLKQPSKTLISAVPLNMEKCSCLVTRAGGCAAWSHPYSWSLLGVCSPFVWNGTWNWSGLKPSFSSSPLLCSGDFKFIRIGCLIDTTLLCFKIVLITEKITTQVRAETVVQRETDRFNSKAMSYKLENLNSADFFYFLYDLWYT